MNKAERFAMSLLIGVCMALVPLAAHASYVDWHVYDNCATSSPYFFVDGPTYFVFENSYYGGIPEPGGGQSCTTWTWTEKAFNQNGNGNSAYWYLPVSPPSTGTFSFWAFVPGNYATTLKAPYEIWMYGHNPCCNGPQYVCKVNQNADANLWHRINDSTVSTCVYAIDGSPVTFSRTSTVWMCADSNPSFPCGALIRLRDDDGVGNKQIAFDDLMFCGPNGSNPTVCPGGSLRY